MRYSGIIILVASILLGGCASKPSNAMSEEDFERLKNGEVVVVNNSQSRGLLGDMIDSTYKTVTGTK